MKQVATMIPLTTARPAFDKSCRPPKGTAARNRLFVVPLVIALVVMLPCSVYATERVQVAMDLLIEDTSDIFVFPERILDYVSLIGYDFITDTPDTDASPRWGAWGPTGLLFGSGSFNSGLFIDQSLTELPPASAPGGYGSYWTPDSLSINSRDLSESPAKSDRLEFVSLFSGGTTEFGFPDLPVIGEFVFQNEESRFEGDDLEPIIFSLTDLYEEATFRLSFTNPTTGFVESISGSITAVTVSTIPVPGALWLFGSALAIAGIGYSSKRK